MSRQDSNGSFGLWSVGGNDVWLDAYVTDFLTRARERGFKVPAGRLPERARPSAQLRRHHARSEQERRRRSRLCALRAGAQRRGADRRSALHRRHADRPDRHAHRQGADRRRAGHARRQDPRGPRLWRRAGGAAGQADAGQLRPRRLRLAAARCGGAGDARLGGAGLGPHRRPRGRARRRRARRVAHTSTQEDAWMVLAARSLSKELNAISLSLNGGKRQGALYRSLSRRQPRHAAQGDEQRRRHGSGGGLGLRRADSRRSPPPSTDSRSSATTTRSTASRPIPRHAKQNQRFVVVLKVTEPQPQFGRVVVADLSAGWLRDRQSASRVLRRHRHAALDHRRRRRRCTANSATTVSPRPSTAPRSRSRCSPSPMWCGRCRRALRAAAGQRRGHVPARPFRPHRDRHDRDHGRNEALARIVLRAALGALAVLVAARRRAGARSCGSIRLGPAPLGRHLRFARRARPRRHICCAPIATPEGRWRLPATVEDVDPRFLKMLFAYEDKRFYEHHGVDPLAMLRAACQFVTQRPYRLGRLDLDHAGRPPAGAARAPHLRRQAAADLARAGARARAAARTRSSRST